jgi:DDE family transposase
MARRRPEIREKDLQGLKYFRLLLPLLERLHDDATARDRAGNRQLFFDQYACLILLYFFNPIVTSLRAIQQASALSKVQKLFGCERASLGSLSEASRVFAPELLREILGELSDRAAPLLAGQEAAALRGLTAVDGTLFRALPKMAWALWQDEQHRAAKLHVHFDVLKGVPTQATLTAGSSSERNELRATLRPGRFYVIDRGYAEYAFFQEIIDANASFVGRIQDHAAFRVTQERSLSPEATAAGIVRDVISDKLGTDHHKNVLKQSVRIVVVATGKTNPDGTPDVLVLCTDRLDLAPELVALAYQYRWQIELFFRWFKCILGCRHLLSTSVNGLMIQMYLGLIASLLVSLWTGRKPTKRTLEMLCFYFAGWASEEELLAHIETLKAHA